MISVKDILDIKLANKIAYPLFGVAAFTSFYDLLPSLLSSGSGVYVSFFVVVPALAFVAFGVQGFISDLDVKYFGGYIFPLLGLGLLGFGLLVISKATGNVPVIDVGVFWYLWALAHSVILLNKPDEDKKS